MIAHERGFSGDVSSRAVTVAISGVHGGFHIGFYDTRPSRRRTPWQGLMSHLDQRPHACFVRECAVPSTMGRRMGICLRERVSRDLVEHPGSECGNISQAIELLARVCNFVGII